jgi:hypothetical protein
MSRKEAQKGKVQMSLEKPKCRSLILLYVTFVPFCGNYDFCAF